MVASQGPSERITQSTGEFDSKPHIQPSGLELAAVSRWNRVVYGP